MKKILTASSIALALIASTAFASPVAAINATMVNNTQNATEILMHNDQNFHVSAGLMTPISIAVDHQPEITRNYEEERKEQTLHMTFGGVVNGQSKIYPLDVVITQRSRFYQTPNTTVKIYFNGNLTGQCSGVGKTFYPKMEFKYSNNWGTAISCNLPQQG